MIRILGACLAGTIAIALLTSAGGEDASYSLHDYARDCAAKIAEPPVLSCLDLDLIPITVNGETPESYSPKMRCDRPALLPFPENTDGNCSPYSRVKVLRDDDIQMVQTCRRMFIRPLDDPHFDSIELIMHNVKSGSTCFFSSKNFGSKPEGIDASRVPPPTEPEPPEGAISAAEFWATPQEVYNRGCIYCHDSDPWMRTPWIEQTGQLPANPFGYYAVDIGKPFEDWPELKSITTRGNTCTGCHRIGHLNTCRQIDIPEFGEQPAKMLQAIGQAPHGRMGARPGTIYESPPEFTDDEAATYPRSAWMPPGNLLPYSEWHEIYAADVADLQRCCNDPEAPGCIVQPIQGYQSWVEEQVKASQTDER